MSAVCGRVGVVCGCAMCWRAGVNVVCGCVGVGAVRGVVVRALVFFLVLFVYCWMIFMFYNFPKVHQKDQKNSKNTFPKLLAGHSFSFF